MTVSVNAADSAAAVKEELIKDLGNEYTIPDWDDVAKYSLAKCAQLADELKDKGFMETTIAGFAQMSLPDKRETLMKVLKDLFGPPVDDDPILKFAIQIEKVNTRAEIEEIFREVDEVLHFGQFKLGGCITVAHELFKKPKSEFAGFKTFRQYIETVHGIRYDKAMRFAGIYRKLRNLGVPWSAFENIGWTKVLALCDVVTNDNVKEWVAKAKVMNLGTLKDHVEAEKQKNKTGAEQKPKTTWTKTFKLHDDQKQLWEKTRKKAEEETGSAVEASNLEAICQNYMGAGLQFADWKQALAYASKHSDDGPLFISKVMELLRQLCPELSISYKITLKEQAPA